VGYRIFKVHTTTSWRQRYILKRLLDTIVIYRKQKAYLSANHIKRAVKTTGRLIALCVGIF